jgi:O-antigen/teichoic acid export membrane protein
MVDEALYHGADEEWNRIFRLLMISYIPVSMVYVHGTILLAQGALKRLNLITFSGLIINLVLNLLLIPRMQAFGATLATLCTQIFVSSCFLYFSTKVVRLNISKKSALQYGFYPLLIAGGAYLLFSIELNHWLAMSLLRLIAGAGAFLLGIFRITEFKSLMNMGLEAISNREGID